MISSAARFILAFAVIAFLAAPPARAAYMYDPCLKWRSIKTEHFRIHYHQGLEYAAQRMAVIAEKVHLKLSLEIQWTPALRTDLVLSDIMDSANGYATPYPYNRVELFIVRPDPDSNLDNFDDWLESVFIHEYTHTLNIDTVHGISQTGRYVLGRNPLFYPNLFQPLWIIEGNAVYHESEKKPFGRNNSLYTDMIMRTEALSGNFKSIGKASHFTREWPKGRVPYLYGGLFIQYLEDTYGKGSFARYMHENGDNIIPFSDNIYPIPQLFNKDAQDVYRKPFFMLWKEWQEKLIAGYKTRAAEIEKTCTTGIRYITDARTSSRSPRFSADGRTVYYLSTSDSKGQHLYAHDLEKNSDRRLCRVNSPTGLSIAGSGDIIVTDQEYYRNFSIYSEGFILKKLYRQKTSRLRGKYIEAFNGGLAYITCDRDRYSLVVSGIDFKNPREIISKTPVQLSCVRVSPDGTMAAFTIKDGRGYTDLALINLQTYAMTRITEDMSSDTSPAWLPYGKKIVFVSDRSGTYNLHEYDLESRTMKRITNVTGGLFTPDISADGTRIAVSSYQPGGFRIGIIDYPLKSYDEAVLKPQAIDMDFFSAQETPGAGTADVPASAPYNAWTSVLPAFYAPVLSTQEFIPNAYDFITGVSTQGNDTLGKHSYFLGLYLYIIQMRLGIDARYTYSGLYPDITIGYYDDAIFLGPDEFPWESHNSYAIQRKLYRMGYLSNTYPFITSRVQQYFKSSYILEQEFEDTYYPGIGKFHDTTRLGEMQFTYTINNAYVYPYSVSREHGRDLVVTADIYSKYFGSEEDFYKVSADYYEYLPGFYANSVILLRVRGGMCFEKPDEMPYSLGRYENGFIGSPASGDDGLGIRGYPAGVVRGNYLMAGTVEVRLPLVQKDASYLTVPVMFRDFWMNVFFDMGSAFDGPVAWEKFGYSVGAELNLKVTLGYNYDITARIGYAYGFTGPGGHQVYFALGTFIEGTIYPPGANPRSLGKRQQNFFSEK